MKTIAPLRAGDRVALAATARKVSPDEMAPAIARLESWGLRVEVPEGLYEECHQMAGTDCRRAKRLQRLLDDEGLKAIICCRGGYGTVRIVDRLDFAGFAAHPKWIVGYSDVTVLHSHVQATTGLPTLHATMPINWQDGDAAEADLRSLRACLTGQEGGGNAAWGRHALDRPGTAEGTLTGGNLSILYSLLGSPSQVDTRGKILVIEDLDEYLYHIDRMMQALKRAGMLEGLAGLVVGHMSGMHDNSVPFGHTAEEIVARATAGYSYPVAYGAPIGHIVGQNRCVVLGARYRLTVGGAGGNTLEALG